MLTVAIPVHLVQERGSVELYEVSSFSGQREVNYLKICSGVDRN
jgi:hypothetical protein